VTRRFGPVIAVDDVSLDIPPGEFVSLLGPSGCGKTTLLRIVAGLDTPDVGRILVDGTDITRLPPERRPFNMVFQRYALFPHLTVYDNVAFGLTINPRERPPKDEVRRRVTAMLELVGLSGYHGRYPGQLSGGQAQRVALARALVREPRVLLLDEPLAALDRNVRNQVREELLRIHAELGTTFLFVTHDQDEALSISSLVALMNGGRLEQVAEPQVLYHQPATLFAAGFVGAGSLLDGKAVRRGADGTLEVDLGGVRFGSANTGVEPGQAVTVLLRPEDLALEGTAAARLHGVVETCAFFGSFFELTLRTRLGVIRLRDRLQRERGSTVGITWPAVAGIAYPAAAGAP
jgi:ABC-type Fe3+/spermidine/putrescine transport system ATPase subunit